MRLNWIGIVILLLAGLVLVHNLTAWKDIEFGDETTYLGSGLTFSIPFKGGAQWGLSMRLGMLFGTYLFPK